MKTIMLAALLLALSIGASTAHATEYVTNGNFSAGLTGWSTNSNAFYTDRSGYHEGAVGFDADLHQIIIGAVGTSLLQFDFGSTLGWYQYVLWDGVNISGNQSPGAFTHYSFAVTGTGNDSLDFFGRNDPSYFTLTNVSVTAVPVPEPGTMILLGASMLVLGIYGKRRANKRDA